MVEKTKHPVRILHVVEETGLGSDETWLKRILRTNGDSLQMGLSVYTVDPCDCVHEGHRRWWATNSMSRQK